MAHDPKKKQRLTDFDFSSTDAHVALVGKAANGKEKFLVVKNLNPQKIEKQDFLVAFQNPELDNMLMEMADEMVREADDKPKAIAELPLEDLLRIFFYMWGEDAKVIAESIVIKSDDANKDALREALLKRLQAGGDRSGAAGKTKVEKSTTENENGVKTMSDKAPEQVDVAKAIADAVATQKAEADAKIADLQKAVDAMKAREEAVELAKYVGIAKSLEVLGATDKTGAVLKAVAGIEGGQDVLSMLTKAVETLTKGDALKEIGTGLGVEAEDKVAKLEAVAKSIVAAEGVTFQAAMVLAADRNPQLV